MNKQSYKDIKIAVYAICKDESKFVRKWITNMWYNGRGADGVYVLDTGSTDNTLEQFREMQKELNIPEGWLTITQKVYKPWRFDTPRNDNMDMINPDQYDVFYCIDLDELVIDDFWDDLRKIVFEHPNFERILYQYAWSHDNVTGQPKWYFWYDKIHGTKGWRWDYPVHEALKCDVEKYGYSGTYYMDSSKIYLHHYPDQSKSRSSYLGLLELRAKEYKDDLYGLYYLSREYSYVNDIENALKTAIQLYSRLLKGNPTAEELSVRDDMAMLPSTCVMIGNYFNQLQMVEDAEYYYMRAIKSNPEFRDGYIKLAQLYAYTNKPQECYQVIQVMDEKSIRLVSWQLVDYYWRDWKRYQIIADAKCWEGKYDEAMELFNKALEDIQTVDDEKDAYAENFYNDLQFVRDCVKYNL